MPISQNLRFNGVSPTDNEFEHPIGADIIRKLQKNLKNNGWVVKPFENWRDCGWSLSCGQNNVKMEVNVSAIKETEWMLQVAPIYTPGLIGRLMKRKSSASECNILELAKNVHDFIRAENEYDKLMWCWDDFPEESNSTSKPERFN